jgi:hypothetical protein
MTVFTHASTFLVAMQPSSIAAAPLIVGVGVFAGGLMGGLMVVQDFKLRKRAEVSLEENVPITPIAPAAIVRQSVRQPFKRLVRR